jgi:hypothetical protein
MIQNHYHRYRRFHLTIVEDFDSVFVISYLVRVVRGLEGRAFEIDVLEILLQSRELEQEKRCPRSSEVVTISKGHFHVQDEFL